MDTKVSSVAALSALPGFGKLQANLRQLAKAEFDGHRTPLFSGQDPFDVLSNWWDYLQSNCPKHLLPLEGSELTKFGPYFVRPYAKWDSAVTRYYGPSVRDADLGNHHNDLQDAIARVVSDLQIYNKLTPYSISQTFERSRKNTNLGLPSMKSEWESAGPELGYCLRRAQLIVDGKRAKLYPFVLFRRVQPGGPRPEDAKQRPVWGADHAETFANLSVAHVCLDNAASRPGYEHLMGIDPLEKAIQRVAKDDLLALSMDLSACDATFREYLQRMGLEMISSIVHMHPKHIESTLEYYNNGELVTPSGILKGRHGLPSGVALTNLIETLLLRALQYVCIKYSTGSYPDPAMVFQNGDDGLTLATSSLKDIYKSTFDRFGLVFNEDKSSEERGRFSYLQRHFYAEDGYLAIMSTVRMLNRIIYAERGLPSKLSIPPKQYWTLNTIMKLENCKRHPNFEYFVKFVANADKYKLDLDFELPSGQRLLELFGWTPLSEGQSGTGLKDFETVKVLATL